MCPVSSGGGGVWFISRDTCKNVHSRFIHSGPKLETAQTSINTRMEKKVMTCSHPGTVSSRGSQRGVQGPWESPRPLLSGKLRELFHITKLSSAFLLPSQDHVKENSRSSWQDITAGEMQGQRKSPTLFVEWDTERFIKKAKQGTPLTACFENIVFLLKHVIYNNM